MKLDFLTVLINVGVLMLLALPGFIFRKKNILKSGDSKPLVVLLIYVTQVFLIIMSFQGKKYSPDILGNMGIAAGFAALIHILMLIFSRIIFSFFKIDRDKKGVYTFASVFANCGYMGIPIVTAIFFGTEFLSEMLIYLSVYIAIFNITNWTVGIYVISGNKKYISLKNALLNPTVIALYIALPLFFGGITLSEIAKPLANAFDLLGNMTTPLSMIILGIKVAEMPLRQIFETPLVYLSAFIKLLIMPVFMLVILMPFAIPDVLKFVLIIVAAMPTATLTVANTERFGGDSLTAAKCMLCSTLLSVITIPLICLLL